jgi:hypothetical protein
VEILEEGIIISFVINSYFLWRWEGGLENGMKHIIHIDRSIPTNIRMALIYFIIIFNY